MVRFIGSAGVDCAATACYKALIDQAIGLKQEFGDLLTGWERNFVQDIKEKYYDKALSDYYDKALSDTHHQKEK